jgi:hypothetical protein
MGSIFISSKYRLDYRFLGGSRQRKSDDSCKTRADKSCYAECVWVWLPQLTVRAEKHLRKAECGFCSFVEKSGDNIA